LVTGALARKGVIKRTVAVVHRRPGPSGRRTVTKPNKEDAMPANCCEPLTDELIQRALDRIGLPYRYDCDGDLYIRIPGGSLEAYLQCWFLIEGETCRLFRLSCLVQPPIPWQNVTDALAACQAFHETFRFGRLLLHADEGRRACNFRFEGQIDVTPGISDALLETYIRSHVASVLAFLAQACRDTRLFVKPPPKRHHKPAVTDGKKRKNRRRSGKKGDDA
jgi:Putative bacterial sensory transduction regulator